MKGRRDEADRTTGNDRRQRESMQKIERPERSERWKVTGSGVGGFYTARELLIDTQLRRYKTGETDVRDRESDRPRTRDCMTSI